MSYTPTVELVVGRANAELSFSFRFFIAICQFRHAHMRKDNMQAFPYCKKQKAGWGLGTSLVCVWYMLVVTISDALPPYTHLYPSFLCMYLSYMVVSVHPMWYIYM